jgi:type I restriction enzyme S subunit
MSLINTSQETSINVREREREGYKPSPTEAMHRFHTADIEFLELQEIFTMKNGYTPSTTNVNYWKNGTIPWFRMEDIRANGRILSKSIQYITEDSLKGGRVFPENSILVATSATIGEHALVTVPHLSNQRFTSLSLKPEFKDKLDIHFVYYYCFLLDKWCLNNTTKSSFASVDMNGFKRFKFPIPPLAVQEEIVRILDSFTALTTELTTELTTRKKQYAYYREKLLSFPSGLREGYKPSPTEAMHRFHTSDVVWKPLGDVAEYSTLRISAEYLNEDNYVGVENLLPNREGKASSNYVPKSGTLIKYNDGDVLIGNIRPYLKKIWHANCSGGTNGDVLVIQIKNERLSSRYLYQVLADDRFFEYNMQHAKGAKMPRGSKSKIMDYPIPIPPLGVQEEIVRILDKFDTLTQSISEGLPREIALRQKQYEYYRDLLLHFPKPIVGEGL